MKLEHSFAVNAPADRVWDFLMDIPAMAGCIPGASDVAQVSDDTYDATVTARIGPISARFGCRISVTNLDPTAHTGTVDVSGRDSKLGGSVKAHMQMSMTETDGSTSVHIVSDVDVMGRIGQYGHGMLTKRADAMLTEFADCARSRLEDQG
jgi:uncharacterized protein